MNRSRRVVNALVEVCDLISSLDLAALPEISMVTAKPHRGQADTIDATAMLRPSFGSEIKEIDKVRAWAVALGGAVQLGDEADPGTDYASRTLSALIPLPSGGLFEVWIRLFDLRPAPVWTPTDADLISA